MRPNQVFLAIFTLVLTGATAPAGSASDQPRTARACVGPEHRQFDFWIGVWEVHTPDGKAAGTNRIERILGGCVLQESWIGAGGMRGMSFNMYSAADQQWHQTWVDSGRTWQDAFVGLYRRRPQSGGSQ